MRGSEGGVMGSEGRKRLRRWLKNEGYFSIMKLAGAGVK